jgi:N4-(beta-N-acetylglucosaminyl)-L-asparaginase
VAGKLSRREFVKVGAAGTAVLGARSVLAQGPTMMVRKTAPPVVIASANGNRFKNGGPRTCVEEAFGRITKGEDVLDALLAGVNIVELDPEEDAVGYGGLPNADGVVQLDSCCMHGPKKRAGGVAALEGVRTASLVAKAVMELTDHHLIVGKDAQAFARRVGFAVEDDLNTEHSRKMWLEWKRRVDPAHYLDPARRSAEAERVRREMLAEGLLHPERYRGTINCNGVSARGEVCGVTTTSGLAFKIPGRVGDSPILGAGLYVDGEVGAAGSTGRGEANLYNLCSFFVVEELRRGVHPKDAALGALRRVATQTIERRLLDAEGRPNFGLSFYAVSRSGEFAGVSMYSSYGGKPVTFAVCTEKGPEILPCEGLFEDLPTA